MIAVCQRVCDSQIGKKCSVYVHVGPRGLLGVGCVFDSVSFTHDGSSSAGNSPSFAVPVPAPALASAPGRSLSLCALSPFAPASSPSLSMTVNNWSGWDLCQISVLRTFGVAGGGPAPAAPNAVPGGRAGGSNKASARSDRTLPVFMYLGGGGVGWRG